MRTAEGRLSAVIPVSAHASHNEEVLSMSDYAHGGSRSRSWAENKTIESRLMFGFLYVLFLFRAVASRLMPWRKQISFGSSGHHDSIFAEARSAAGTMVTSSFMGL